MRELKIWEWTQRHIPKPLRWKERTLIKVYGATCANPADWDEVRMSDCLLITGDGQCSPKDLNEFESWKVPHDVLAVNRSMLLFQRPIQHWTSIDNEESVWFTEHVSEKVIPPGKPIWKHTIGGCRGYDFYWIANHPRDATDFQKYQWGGNSGFFAILIAAEMGYKKVILSGMPLDNSPHWYDPPGTDGPMWMGFVYQQWMDYKSEVPFAANVRSMSGYTGFIFGKATKEWFLDVG